MGYGGPDARSVGALAVRFPNDHSVTLGPRCHGRGCPWGMWLAAAGQTLSAPQQGSSCVYHPAQETLLRPRLKEYHFRNKSSAGADEDGKYI